MKRSTVWKIVLAVTILILAGFLAFVGSAIIRNLNYAGYYPYPTIAGEVHNWWEGTIVDVGIFFPFYCIPLIGDIVLLIVSCVMIKKAGR